MRLSLRNASLVVAALCLGGVAVSSSFARTSRHARVFSTGGTRPLRTAIVDPAAFGGPQRATAFEMTRAAGASYARIVTAWSSIAPATRPNGFSPRDPDSPGYSWGSIDAIVEEAEAAGLTPILDVISPPPWAYAVRPHGTYAGTPKVDSLHAFAYALASHFDGSHGAPAVHVFQVWNEPNLSLDLYPVKARNYRKMVNGFAASAHAVDAANIVVAGGLDPFQNSAKRFRSVAPLTFMRKLLCLSKGRHPHPICKAQVHFDVWSHHPYTFGGPFGHARLKSDVSLGDLPRMRALLRAAVRRHKVVHARPVQFWVTEFGWDTNPPRTGAAPLKLQARWTAEALWQMWRSGVSLVTWYLLEDHSSPSPYQSGLFFHAKTLTHARAKPMREALRFPFVAYRRGGGIMVWGRDPASAKQVVAVQRRKGKHGGWRTIARIRANRNGIFAARLHARARKKEWLRAKDPGAGKSLPFSLKTPRARRFGPWGN